MASIQSDAGDYFGAQESLSLSLKYLDTVKKLHRACLTSDYNELGLTKLDLQDPEAAVPYFEKAIKITDNADYRKIYLNNKALAYQQSGAYLKALAIYRELIHYPSDSGTYARILTNKAMSEWGADKQYKAVPLLLSALSIRWHIKDNWGLNSSFANLATYYEDTKPDSSLFYAHQQYAVATLLNSPDDRLHALQQLTELSPALPAKRFFKVYHELDDSLQKARNAAKNQFALIRYNVQRKEADNLRLQKENAEANTHLVEQRLIILIISILVVAGGAFGIIWYRKREQNILLEARKKELALSQRIHDVVANGLYKVMKGVENSLAIDKDALLDGIELLYEQSRDISYEPIQQHQGAFASRISNLVDSFSNEKIRTAISGNEAAVWDNVPRGTQEQLLSVLQELLVNMAKHSRAKLAVLNFQRSENKVILEMIDDGIGLPPDINYGNGLNSTVSRIQAIKGTITFEPNLPSGTVVNITIPVA
ncbi:unnamed protein product [Sphagnum tenellum]